MPRLLHQWAVYGLDFAGNDKLVDDPIQLHRGWPGFGFTHSLTYGLVPGALIWLLSRNRIWAISFFVGVAAHVLSDSFDSVGVMMFFSDRLAPAPRHLGVVGQAGLVRRLFTPDHRLRSLPRPADA